MNRNYQLALIVGYYLSRFDRQGLKSLGYSTFEEAYKATSDALGIKSSTIKNMRDEFDPYFDNPRVGWNQRELGPSRQTIINKFTEYSQEEMKDIVQCIIVDPSTNELNEFTDKLRDGKGYILKDLNEIAKYTKEQIEANFKPEEVILSEEFKNVFGSYIRENGQDISFQNNTAIITSAGNLKIYAPNQWFVIASFLVDFMKELINYKKHLDEILSTKFSRVKEKNEFIKSLKSNSNEKNNEKFIALAQEYFQHLTDDREERERGYGHHIRKILCS